MLLHPPAPTAPRRRPRQRGPRREGERRAAAALLLGHAADAHGRPEAAGPAGPAGAAARHPAGALQRGALGALAQGGCLAAQLGCDLANLQAAQTPPLPSAAASGAGAALPVEGAGQRVWRALLLTGSCQGGRAAPSQPLAAAAIEVCEQNLGTQQPLANRCDASHRRLPPLPRPQLLNDALSFAGPMLLNLLVGYLNSGSGSSSSAGGGANPERSSSPRKAARCLKRGGA